LEIKPDQPTRTETIARLIAQVQACLRSGDYTRAVDLLRGNGAEFANDPELSKLEKLALDGIKRKAEAQRLISESGELFAQQKSAEAIELLRKAYEIDKTNSLARTILANALVEHARSIVETDWLGAETLTHQALALNPAHPTAKTILSLIVDKKKRSSVEDWVSQARKLQSSGDLFAALAWVAEGLAVHPDDPKLLLIEDTIQRDQEARRRQARRGDLDELRRLQREIGGATEVTAKQALAERIQALAAKHWTDGEILSIANALLLRLRLVPGEGSSASPRGKGAAVIFHVPRPSAPKPAAADTGAVSRSPAATSAVTAANVPSDAALPNESSSGNVPLRTPPLSKVQTTPAETEVTPLPAAASVAGDHFVTAVKVTSSSTRPKQPSRSNSNRLIVVSTAAAILLFAATLFFWGKRYVAPVAKSAEATPSVPAPAVSDRIVSAPATTAPEPAPPASSPSSNGEGKATVADPAPAEAQGGRTESGQNSGTLVVVAGQDNAKVTLNGKLQRQLTRSGQLRLANLEPKDYVVQVTKSGFQDPPQQQVRIHGQEEARLIFNLEPQPGPAALTILGGAPGTTVLVDQTPVGTVQPDGTLAVASVNAGDHIVELRKEGFRPRQLKEHFVAGGTISLAATDATLEASPAELKVTFTPVSAKVSIVKDGLSTNVSSGVPLTVAAGSYTLSARTSEGFTFSSTLELIAGQPKALDLSFPTSGVSKWDDPSNWKRERDSFGGNGGNFVLYKAVPAAGTFVFSAMPTKGRPLQWVLNYTDPMNYVLFQIDDDNFYRTVIRNGEKRDEVKISDKRNKKSPRTVMIRVSPTELVHQIRHEDGWMVVDHWTQPGANLTQGKFGFYIVGDGPLALSSFTHLGDMNSR